MTQPYKSLQRQLRRLPLPRGIIAEGSQVLKQHYRLGKSKRFEIIFQQILEQEKYKSIHEVLDAIYKVDKPHWYMEFSNIPYMRVKGHWPTAHLIDTLTEDVKTRDTYYNKLAKPFSVTEALKLKQSSKSVLRLPLIRQYSGQVNSVVNMVKEVRKAYFFIMSQRVFEITKHPFEVIYHPSKLGVPEHPVGIDSLLRKKVSQVKHVLEMYQPILIRQLTKLMNARGEINPNFFRHLQRKRADDTTSYQVRKMIIKEKILSEESLQGILESYLRQQYYLENGEYKLNQMCNSHNP
ncbi:hypothetical protein KGF57_001980 [Candida theae]|uniref:Genetic interactor of prohibitin 5, mitochondrial n=1 Tax=Candida theae TaxID=1198502 RepID=A0AAD5FZ73_9ASCO|nr:uncharacterized protein KGF57_001980 [Candida theae]KAI5960036.1 hypothetical protein KGF57_001980 [Candida theae]